MKTIFTSCALLLASFTAHSEIDPNNFWGTDTPVDTSVTYDAMLAVELNDIYHNAIYVGTPKSLRLAYKRTNLTFTSKSDNLIIRGVTVNRGNCEVYVYSGLYDLSLKAGGTKKFEIYSDKRDGYNIIVPFGKKYTIGTSCNPKDIIEITIDTPTNQLIWNTNN